MSNLLAEPVDEALSLLPKDWQKRWDKMLTANTYRTVKIALLTMGAGHEGPAQNWMHKFLAMGTGAAGGFFGPLTLSGAFNGTVEVSDGGLNVSGESIFNDDVGVAAEPLGGRFQDEIDPQLQGAAEVRRRERVVDEQRQSRVVRDVRHRLDVEHVDDRVAERLAVDQLGLVGDRTAEVLRVVGIDEDGPVLEERSVSVFDRVDRIRDGITYMELNVNQDFMNRFSAAKFLPHTDPTRFPSVKVRNRKLGMFLSL